LLIPPPELSGNYQQRHRVAKQEKFGEEIAAEFFIRSIFFILYSSGGQTVDRYLPVDRDLTVDRDRLFGRSRPLFSKLLI
jgi:hypothetical protein